jgi:predicted type IV restriction endonuclease
MSIDQKFFALAEKIRSYSSTMATEEAVKTSVVLPFLHALGYDVFDPNEVVPEFTADAVGKKGEKVDYAIKIDGVIRILVECKPITTNLDKVHLAQLYRYFSVTSAKFAILTNGRTFHFHTDLDEPNKLDPLPFLTFDLSDVQPHLLSELKKFERTSFDVDGILATAERLKYTSAIKGAIAKLIDEPSDEFVRMVAKGLYTGNFTASIKDQFGGLVRSAFREVVRDSVATRLNSALAVTAAAVEAPEPLPDPDEIVTTDDEREGYLIVKSIVREVIKPSRVFMRDAKSYCAVLVDNNNRKPLTRLHFNRPIKYISLFDGDKEERAAIDSLDHIYDYTDRLRATASRYSEE